MRRIFLIALAALAALFLIALLWALLSALLSGKSTKKVTERQSLPFQVQTKQDSGLPVGQRVKDQQGQTGTKEVTYKITLKRGKEISRTLDSEKVLSQPKNEVDRVGTAQPSSSLDSGITGNGASATPTAGQNTLWDAIILLGLLIGARLYSRSARDLRHAAQKRA